MDNGLNGQNVNQVAQGQIVPYTAPMAAPGMGMGSSSLFHIFWRSWWLIVLLSALGVGGAFLYLKKWAPDPTYRSRALLLVEEPQAVRDDGTLVVAPGAGSKTFHETQAALIMSRQIIRRALEDSNLALKGASDANYIADLVGTLSAQVQKTTELISVTAAAPEPNDAAKFVNAVVDAYQAWHETQEQLGVAGKITSMSGELSQYEEQLTKAKRDVSEERRRLVDAADIGAGVSSERLEELKRQSDRASAEAEGLRRYYEALQRYETQPDRFCLYANGNASSQGFVVDIRERVALEEELKAIESELDAIEGGAVAQYSQIARLEKRKTELEKEIGEFDTEFVANHLNEAKNRWDEAKSRASQSAEEYREAKDGSQTVTYAEGRLEELLQVRDSLVARCNKLREAIIELNIKMPPGIRIHVLEDALPGTPTAVQRARVLGMGLVAGMMLGSGLAFVRDLRDQRVRSADEITAILGVPVLGAIPKIAGGKGLGRNKKARFSPHSRESEACRGIRTALFFGPSKEEASAVLVTSPGPKEGKTTLVSNLGISMAHAGQRTLIIDADLRKPMQERMFAMKGTGKGLTDLLAGSAKLDETICPTKIQGLDVLVSGQNVSNPSELLNGEVFPGVLAELRERYDRIIIDSPPVGVVTDGQILAAMCDLTLIVLRAKRSTRPVTQRARDALHTVGARIAGAVVNDVSKRDRRYSHYSGYDYYYGNHAMSRQVASKEIPADVTPNSRAKTSASGQRQWDDMFPQG